MVCIGPRRNRMCGRGTKVERHRGSDIYALRLRELEGKRAIESFRAVRRSLRKPIFHRNTQLTAGEIVE